MPVTNYDADEITAKQQLLLSWLLLTHINDLVEDLSVPIERYFEPYVCDNMNLSRLCSAQVTPRKNITQFTSQWYMCPFAAGDIYLVS